MFRAYPDMSNPMSSYGCCCCAGAVAGIQGLRARRQVSLQQIPRVRQSDKSDGHVTAYAERVREAF